MKNSRRSRDSTNQKANQAEYQSKQSHKQQSESGGKLVSTFWEDESKEYKETNNLSDADLKEQSEIMKYWFLLDEDLRVSIERGNLKWKDIATARIKYLKKVIKPSLLDLGLNGEEESLWEIQRFLFNNGWWVKANRLSLIGKDSNRVVVLTEPSTKDKLDRDEAAIKQFIRAYKEQIDPNVFKMAENGNVEGIRMALNQIHQGSIQKGRELKNQKESILSTPAQPEDGREEEAKLRAKLLAAKEESTTTNLNLEDTTFIAVFQKRYGSDVLQ